MEDKHVTPSPSPAEREEFFATGEDARTGAGLTEIKRQFENAGQDAAERDLEAGDAANFADHINPEEPASVGIDTPAVGVVYPNEDQDPTSPTRSGRANAAGEVPQPLRDFVDGVVFTENRCAICGQSQQERAEAEARRDGLLSQLLSAVRDLVESRLKRQALGAFCRECISVGSHSATCKTGRVLGLLDQVLLDALTSELARQARATARPRGLSHAVCVKCGSRGGNWLVEHKDGQPDLSSLSLNQLVGVSFDDAGFAIYTHLCEVKARDRGLAETAWFGEPWKYVADVVLDQIRICDREGTLICLTTKCDQEALDWASRIVDSVNSYSGCLPLPAREGGAE